MPSHDIRAEGTPPSGGMNFKTWLAYVLVTPAHNEAAFIDRTIESVVQQTVLPVRWVIVDDGSTDDTPNIVRPYLSRFPWIDLIQMPQRVERNFVGKVRAFNAGYERLNGLAWDILGNIDADISLAPDEFEFLLKRFEEDPTLGVAGPVCSERGWDSAKDSYEGRVTVHGACQLFRKECFLEIGGYQANRAGGVDWIAVTTARMKGWKTRNYPDRYFLHHRPMGTAQRNPVFARFDYGRKDYFLGGSLFWEFFRAAYQMTKRPLLVGGLALFFGYCWSALKRESRPVSNDLMRFHRKEQMRRLRAILGFLARFKKIDRNLITE